MPLPWFPLDAADILTSETILGMSDAEGFSYFLLLCQAWLNKDCTIPDDDAVLARLSRQHSNWPAVAVAIRKVFIPHPDLPGRLHNPRLSQEFARAAAKSTSAAASAQRSHSVRKATAQPTHCEGDIHKDLQGQTGVGEQPAREPGPPHPNTNEVESPENLRTDPPDIPDACLPSPPGRGAGGEGLDPSALRLADLVERDIPGADPALFPGGLQRRRAFAALLEAWHGKPNKPTAAQIANAILATTPANKPAWALLVALRRHPDGAYPGNGPLLNADPSKPSRIEQLVKLNQTLPPSRASPNSFKRFSSPLGTPIS